MDANKSPLHSAVSGTSGILYQPFQPYTKTLYTIKGLVINLEPLLDEYYQCRGWARDSGFPTRAKLEELDLKDVAAELEARGRLG